MRSRVVRAKSDGRERRNRWAFWSATKSRRRGYMRFMIVAAWSNHSVGGACFMIMEEEVYFRPYVDKGRTGSEGRHSGQPRYLAHVRDGEGLRSWWAHWKMHGLREIQMESLTWMIEQEK